VAQTAQPKQEAQHTVEKGDTLFAIAFQHALDYRDLAFWNNLTSPDLIKVGQVLRLTPPDDAAGRARGVETIPLRESALPSPRTIQDTPLYTEPRAQRLPYSEANWALLSGAPAATAVVLPKTAVQTGTDAGAENPKGAGLPAMPATSSSTTDSDEWRWPVDGALLGTYGEGGGKGINIAGERLTPVVAAAPGKVVYSGAGLRGYGKMLIVKHAGEYLSAYAHNQTLMVKEGDWVKGGQKIAEMGDTDSDCVKLHFEIRQYGKPVDPLKLLPERK
jgi:lipoprotein NlpD